MRKAALLQIAGVGTRKPVLNRTARSDCFDFELLTDELDSLRKRAGSEPERTLHQAGFATDVAGDVERSGLPFAQRAHHFEALDRGVCCFQRLEAANRANQLLQLAMVGLQPVVQVLDLSVDGVFWAFALLLQLCKRDGIGRRLVRVDDVRSGP